LNKKRTHGDTGRSGKKNTIGGVGERSRHLDAASLLLAEKKEGTLDEGNVRRGAAWINGGMGGKRIEKEGCYIRGIPSK